MNAALIQRFIETQTLILSPICPHLCEHIWGTLLGKKGLVVRAAWPRVVGITPPGVAAGLGTPGGAGGLSGEQEVLLRSSTYLMEAAHEFRLRARTYLVTKKVTTQFERFLYF